MRFLYKLIPLRPTFDRDMTEPEREVMGRHVAYWSELAGRGTAIVFGPVADPAGTWGLAVVEADSPDAVRAIGEEDPAVRGGVGRFEVCAMPGAVVSQAAA